MLVSENILYITDEKLIKLGSDKIKDCFKTTYDFLVQYYIKLELTCDRLCSLHFVCSIALDCARLRSIALDFVRFR